MNERKLQITRPCRALRPYVRAIAQRQVPASGWSEAEAFPARLEQTLEFQFRDQFSVRFEGGVTTRAPRTVVVGLNTRRVDIICDVDVESFAVFFQPTGFSRLFHLPASQLSERFFEARAILGTAVDELAEKLFCETFSSRVSIIEHFLLGYASHVKDQSAITHTAEYVFATHRRVSVPELAASCGLQVRQFERRFRDEIGITPKLFSRVARFQAALDAKIMHPELTWLHIAHEFSYHDQMHLVREFREFGAQPPGLLLSQIVDGRPLALAAIHER